MNSHHRAIRALLRTMSPQRAIDYIRSFQLLEEEELFLIECDVRRKTYARIIEEHNDFILTPELIRNRRRTAYTKIADHIKHQESPRTG